MINKRWLLTATLFAMYLLILTKLVVFKLPVDLTTANPWLALSHGNYLPGKTIWGYLSGEPSWRIAIDNLLGNILLFIPLGIFLPSLWRTITGKGIFAVALGFSVILESSQLFVIGTPDIDDVLLNTFGASLGYLAFTWVALMGKKRNAKYL